MSSLTKCVFPGQFVEGPLGTPPKRVGDALFFEPIKGVPRFITQPFLIDLLVDARQDTLDFSATSVNLYVGYDGIEDIHGIE